MTCAGWLASGLLFSAGLKVQVSVYREVSQVPIGKKRPVRLQEPVIQSVVMSREAWATLSELLRGAGAKVEETERPW